MTDFAENQPLDGEPVFHCAHLNEQPNGHNPRGHFFFIPGRGLTVVTADFVKHTANWVILCEDCFSKVDHRNALPSFKELIGGANIWSGNAPVIRNPEPK